LEELFMVDFNNEVTITRPAIDIERVIVLQRRHDCIEAYEGYNKTIMNGAQAQDSNFRSRVLSLFIELKASLTRKYPVNKKEETDVSVTEMQEAIMKGDLEKVFEVFDKINNYLDEIKLTRLDIHKVYDSTRVEVENREKKL